MSKAAAAVLVKSSVLIIAITAWAGFRRTMLHGTIDHAVGLPVDVARQEPRPPEIAYHRVIVEQVTSEVVG